MSNRQESAGDKPLNIGFILFPAFQALDVFGPLDALNILSTKTYLNLFLLTPNPTLAPISTASTNPSLNPFNSNFSESILPTHTFSTAPPLDVLFIPGGSGTRDADTMSSTSQYVRQTYPGLQYVVTICTGAAIAATAGILDGKRATTNKKSWGFVTEKGPKSHWVAKARWVEDGNCWTGAGVSAGIDVTMAWIARVWGEERAEEVAVVMEYNRTTDSSMDPFAERWDIVDVVNGVPQPRSGLAHL